MPTKNTDLQSHFKSVRHWVQEIGAEKAAAAGQGNTTHPSGKADDREQKGTTGSRASENESDVKKMVPVSVDASKPLGQDQDALQPNIGAHQSAVGEDSSVEDDYKDRPKDSPTSHEADASVGEKYSFDLTKSDELMKAAAAMGALANQILADIATDVKTAVAKPKTADAPKASEAKQEEIKQAEAQPAQSPSPAGVAAPNSASAPAQNLSAATAGYELAGMLGLSKEAADANAQATIAGVIQQALILGDRVGRLYADEQRKMAAEEEEIAAPAEAEAAAEPAPPAPGSGDGGGASDGGLAAMLAGGGGGGMPAPAPAPDAGGGMNPQALQELAMALQELGVPLDQLAAAAQGGAGGAPMPGGDEMGPKMAKIAKAVSAHMRSGSFQFTEAKEGTAERKLRNAMKQQVREVLGYK